MKTVKLFARNDIKEVKRYINHYFNEIVGFRGDLTTQQIEIAGIESAYIVILKDDLTRLQRKKGGTGVLRQKPCSIFVFNFIENEEYIKVFGTNVFPKTIPSPYALKNFNDIETVAISPRNKSKYPNERFRSRGINFFLQNFIFQELFSAYKYLFVNAYVYSVIAIKNNQEISKAQYNTYYYNTNYKFESCKYARIISQKDDINKTSYIVEDIKEELEGLNKSSTELLDLVGAYNGELPLNEITSNNYNSIVNDIKNGIPYVITEGMARTGKTVIAMRLLHEFSHARLIVMNDHFLRSLERAFLVLEQKFPADRIISHLQDMEEFVKNSGLLIVDEAQRLSKNEVETILQEKAGRKTVFLGDNLQKLNPQYDEGLDYVVEKLKNKEYRKYYFDYSVGIPLNVLNCIKYLLYPNNYLNNDILNHFEINLFNDQETFATAYFKDPLYKKHLATIYLNDYQYYSFSEFTKAKRNETKRFPYFLDKTFKEKYILSTYELISRELDSVYIYLPKEVLVFNGELEYSPNKGLNEYLKNQLYVLMTRAKGTLNIYCENPSTYQYFMARLNVLKEKTENQNNDNAGESNLSKEEIENKNLLEHTIKMKGITRLVHFTEASNLPSILEKGLLSLKRLEESGLNFDKNDELRLDNKPDAICLSVQNPNNYLLNYYKRKYPHKEYYVLILDPSLLYEINNEFDNELAKREYYNYNAASRSATFSEWSIEKMFEKEVTGFKWRSGNCWEENRINKEDNQTTSVQAEILFFEDIPPKYILEYKKV